MAEALCQVAGVPMDRPASLNDIEAFEEVLGVCVMVVRARLGNKFITSPSSDERPCIYVYLVDDEHYHSITSITSFFSTNYFCNLCLKHYDRKEYHQCDTSCIICKTDKCSKTNTLYYLNPKFQASSHFLWLYSPVCDGPGRKPRIPVFSQRGSFVTDYFYCRWC